MRESQCERAVAMDILMDRVWVSKWSDPERFHPLVQMVRNIDQEGIRHSQPIHELKDQCKSHDKRNGRHHGPVTVFHRISQIFITPSMNILISYHIESDWDKTKVVQ